MDEYLNNELHKKWLKENKNTELSSVIENLNEIHDVFKNMFNMEDSACFHLSGEIYCQILNLMAIDLSYNMEKNKK